MAEETRDQSLYHPVSTFSDQHLERISVEGRRYPERTEREDVPKQ